MLLCMNCNFVQNGFDTNRGTPTPFARRSRGIEREPWNIELARDRLALDGVRPKTRSTPFRELFERKSIGDSASYVPHT